MKKGRQAIEALAALSVFESLKPIHLTDDDLRLIKWLMAGHPNERDEDVQALRRKCERILCQRKDERAKRAR